MRVLIVGAGLAGLTLARCLERNGDDPVVLERSPTLRGAGYMIDFFGSGYDVAERLGLLAELEARHYPIARLSFRAPDGSARFSIPYERMRELLGGRHFNLMRGDLEGVLFDALAGRIHVRFGSTIESLAARDDGVEVILNDGSKERAELLVGADGVHSRVRTLAFGEDTRFVRPLGYHTAAFVFDDPAMRAEIGDAFVTLTVPGRQIALYPIRDGKVATFWVHRSDDPIVDVSAQAAARELREVYGGLGWLVPRVLAHAGDTTSTYFDTVTQVVLPTWSAGRVVLVGDACQCVSLLAGQGASLAVAGAFILAEEIARDRSDVPALLARYERRLKPAVLRKQKAGRNMARWFVPDGTVRLAIRDAVLELSSSALGGWLLRRQISADSVITREVA
jgi:2-polyprenyl-6-methoxyphenol hydroxylase-like FAD-dependent oxidoreductase